MLLDAQSWNNAGLVAAYLQATEIQKWLGRSLSILSILRVPNSDPSIATKGFSKTMKRPPSMSFLAGIWLLAVDLWGSVLFIYS